MSARLVITKDVRKCEVTLERILDGPRQLLWLCFVSPTYIDQWWGPEGWITETKKLEARPGGVWHYRMQGETDEVWGLVQYEELHAPEHIAYTETASNVRGEKMNDRRQHVVITLTEIDNAHTKITIRTRFESVTDMEAMIQMNMIEGYDGALQKVETLMREVQHRAN